MKIKLDQVRFAADRFAPYGWEWCAVCRSKPGGKPTPGTLAYYVLGGRVCDRCVKRGAEHIREGLRNRAGTLRCEVEALEVAIAEGIEIPETSLEAQAKMRLWAHGRIQDHFGVCPVCGESCPYLNVHKTHWFYCDEHEVRWCVGSNLFSSWREEDEEVWRGNEEKLQTFRVVYENIEDDLDLIPEEDALAAAEARIGERTLEDFAEDLDGFPL
jgi:hypothetical protein